MIRDSLVPIYILLLVTKAGDGANQRGAECPCQEVSSQSSVFHVTEPLRVHLPPERKAGCSRRQGGQGGGQIPCEPGTVCV